MQKNTNAAYAPDYTAWGTRELIERIYELENEETSSRKAVQDVKKLHDTVSKIKKNGDVHALEEQRTYSDGVWDAYMIVTKQETLKQVLGI